MEIKLVLLIAYAVMLIIFELLIKKRLDTINKRHHQKIGGGNITFGLFTLFKRLKLIIRLTIFILFLCGYSVIILLV